MLNSKKPLPRLHDRLWVEFSRYIRLRDCLKTTGTTTEGSCITCERIYAFSQLQAGHFISRRHYSTRYDERNVNAQCSGCNVFKAGCLDEYFVKLEILHGREVVNELLSLKHQTTRFTRPELEELIEIYKRKNKEML